MKRFAVLGRQLLRHWCRANNLNIISRRAAPLQCLKEVNEHRSRRELKETVPRKVRTDSWNENTELKMLPPSASHSHILSFPLLSSLVWLYFSVMFSFPFSCCLYESGKKLHPVHSHVHISAPCS
jgi:hypothetical protein